jgi:MHS family proline/betaine transporter-like MFS transporter
MRKFLLTTKTTHDFLRTSCGNILEWYDFSIYGLFAIQIAQTFFPPNDSAIRLTLLIFAMGFIARPLGAVIFGYIGDLKGKHYAVNLSVWCMAIPTTLIGFLPGYAMLGNWAPILLVSLRLAQGLSAGGQFSGLIAIAADNANPNKSFLASLAYAISVLGTLLASIIAFLAVKLLPQVAASNSLLASLAWRLPFVLSGGLFVVYLKLQPKYPNHPIAQSNKFSLRDIWHAQPKELIYSILLAATSGTLFYIFFSYLVTYMQLHLGLTKTIALFMLNLMLIIAIILFPIFGAQADQTNSRINSGKKQLWWIAAGASALLFSHLSLIFTVLGILVMVIAFAAVTGYTTSLFAEVFAANYQMTACSITFNCGFVIAGFAPLLAESLTYFSFGLPLLIISILLIMHWALTQLAMTHGYQQACLAHKI